VTEPPAPSGYPGGGPPPSAAGPPPTPPGYGPYPYGPAPPAKRGIPGWAIALIVVGAVAVFVFILGMMAAIAIPMFLNQRDKAKDSSVKEGVHSIQVAIQSYAVDHNDSYPPESEVARDGEVGTLMQRESIAWPTNPFTNEPMQASPNEGDYTYDVTADGTSFTLTGHLGDGAEFSVGW
jgi:type II secretory pathway pseudopilin PulG